MCETVEAAASACAEALAQAHGHVALAGGSSPERAYELAAQLRPDWSGVELWWGDERCVPPDHEWSNYGMARRALLDRLGRAPRATHRIRGELPAEEAAREYDAELRDVEFDLVLLGIGSDGHTASLFPGGPALAERERLAVAAPPGLEPWVDRVTLTPAALERAETILFLATGVDKAEAVERAFARPPEAGTPASVVRSAHGVTRAILDRAAASRLTP